MKKTGQTNQNGGPQLVDFALIPGPVRKEKQSGLLRRFENRCYYSLTDEPSRVQFSRGFLQHGRTAVRRSGKCLFDECEELDAKNTCKTELNFVNLHCSKELMNIAYRGLHGKPRFYAQYLFSNKLAILPNNFDNYS